jgi:hypothetical protein
LKKKWKNNKKLWKEYVQLSINQKDESGRGAVVTH